MKSHSTTLYYECKNIDCPDRYTDIAVGTAQTIFHNNGISTEVIQNVKINCECCKEKLTLIIQK